MRAKKGMPKRYHLNRPDLAQAVAEELGTCKDVKDQQRLLAARLAASGQLTAAQIAEQLGISRRRFFDWMNALKAGGLSGLFLNHLAASDPEAEHVVIWDQAGFHPKPELHAVPERIHLVPLPPCSPELNPTEAIGDVVKDRIGIVLWDTIADLEQSIGEELRPLCENSECVRRLVSHPWLVEQVNAIIMENSPITCSTRYKRFCGVGIGDNAVSCSCVVHPTWAKIPAVRQ
jgi:transposase-like protein